MGSSVPLLKERGTKTPSIRPERRADRSPLKRKGDKDPLDPPGKKGGSVPLEKEGGQKT